MVNILDPIEKILDLYKKIFIKIIILQVQIHGSIIYFEITNKFSVISYY